MFSAPRILAIATPVVAIPVAITASLAVFFTTQATATVTSDKVSAERIQLIQQNIDSLHPDVSSELKQQILEIAVKAIENQIFVEGGSFMMGDFGMKCKSDLYSPNVAHSIRKELLNSSIFKGQLSASPEHQTCETNQQRDIY